MRPSHHIHQSRRQLKFATRDITAGDYYDAASSLARATSHAATAVGNHWHLLDGMRATRRRLQYILTDLVGKGYASYSLTGVLRESYNLPDRIRDVLTTSATADAAHGELRRILRRTRMRARRLLKAIIRAMADEPNPMTIEQAIARAYARDVANPSPPPPAPPDEALRVAARDAANRLQGTTYSICICHGRRATPCPTPRRLPSPLPPPVGSPLAAPLDPVGRPPAVGQPYHLTPTPDALR